MRILVQQQKAAGCPGECLLLSTRLQLYEASRLTLHTKIWTLRSSVMPKRSLLLETVFVLFSKLMCFADVQQCAADIWPPRLKGLSSSDARLGSRGAWTSGPEAPKLLHAIQDCRGDHIQLHRLAG